MPAMLLTVALILTLLSLLYSLLLSSTNKNINGNKLKLPPGPYNLPIIGNLHRVGLLPHHFLHELSRKHGPLVHLRLGSIPVIVASSADTAREFLKTHDNECCSRPRLTPVGRLTYGFSDVAFAPYGEQWRELRKFGVLNFFSPKKVASFRSVREEEVGRMIDSISNSSSYSINLTEELTLLVNGIVCRSALGKRYECGSDGGRALHQIIVESQAMLNGFFFADYIPALGWVDALTRMRTRLEKNFRDLDAIYERIIDDHLDGNMSEDAVGALLGMEKTTEHLTRDHIKGVLMNIFLGGTDTASTTLDWAMAELMRNPAAMAKAQEEVRRFVRNKPEVEESDLEQLHYLKLVVMETLRLHPAGPLLIQRETTRHFEVLGFDIPARTRLLVNAWAMGRDAGVWERPEEFDPERFAGRPIEYGGQDFKLIPFGAGRRVCPGMNSALPIVELALANLLYLFDWVLPGGMKREDIHMED